MQRVGRTFGGRGAVALMLLLVWPNGVGAQDDESGEALPDDLLESLPMGVGIPVAGPLTPMPPPVPGPALYQPENLDLNLGLLQDLAPDLGRAREIQKHAQDMVGSAEVFQRLGIDAREELVALAEGQRPDVTQSERAALYQEVLIGHADMARMYQEQLPQKAVAEFRRAAELAQKTLTEASQVVQTTEEAWAQAQTAQAQSPGDTGLWNQALEAHRQRTWAPSVVPLARSLLGDLYGDLGRLHLRFLQLRQAEYDFRMVLYYVPPKGLAPARKPSRPAWALTPTSAGDQTYVAAAEVGLGFVYLLRRDFRNANRYFRRALIHRPYDYQRLPTVYRDYCSAARFGLGGSLWDAGFYQEAATELQRALDEGVAVTKYAELAQQVITAFTQRPPSRYVPPPMVFHELLVNHTWLARDAAGLPPLEKEVAAQEHFRRALDLRRNQNDIPGALAEYQKALVARPDFAEARANLAALLELQGQYGQAIQEYQTVLEQRPVFPEGHYALAAVLEKVGRVNEARNHFAIALEQGLRGTAARYAETVLVTSAGSE